MAMLTGIIREGRGVGFSGVAGMVSAVSGDPGRECVPSRYDRHWWPLLLSLSALRHSVEKVKARRNLGVVVDCS